LLAAVSVGLNTDFYADPRFDGAGYAVLGEALAASQGYREIDHPDQPRHAHFPPGYPATLAVIWKITGRSVLAAHVFSSICTVAAVLLSWGWFRILYAPRIALVLGLALAVNWTWGRNGGEIRSEPLFFFLQQLSLLLAVRIQRRGGQGAALLAIVVGASVLTRHVGTCLALALAIPLLLARNWSAALRFGTGIAVMLAPWVGWLLLVGHGTQASLFVGGSLGERVAHQALFYVQRVPDQITGPIVEVGTVFRTSRIVAAGVTAWALAISAIVTLGWLRALRSPRRRLAGLVPLATLGVLLVWPFTEAGRFLVPLVPFVLMGMVEGIGIVFVALVRRGLTIRNPFSRKKTGFRVSSPRACAAVLLVAASVPYAAYAIASRRADAQRRTHRSFDVACAWIVQHGKKGPILTRHPGEVYWRTGRQALAPDSADPEVIAKQIARYTIAYLLIDEERYARAPTNPLSLYVQTHPEAVATVWRQTEGASTVSVVETR
jgi:hypothetical protein